MTAALEGGEWSTERPGRNLPPGKTRYPLYRRLGRPLDRSTRAETLDPTPLNYELLGVETQSLVAHLAECGLALSQFTLVTTRQLDVAVQDIKD